MPKRSTVDVKFILEQTNRFLLHSSDDAAAQRTGMTLLLEDVLHKTGNYRGFQYLNAYDMVNSGRGHSLGIIFDQSDARKHVYPDPTRRVYS